MSFILSILLVNCDECKDDPKPKTELEKLPLATQQGKNTFGCLVDGKAWVTGTSTDADAFYQEGVLSITAVNDLNTEYIYIYIFDELLIEQEYQLPKENLNHISNVAGLDEYKSTTCRFETTSGYMGSVQITHLDQSYGKWIISGTFEFEAYSAHCQKVVKITDGRFDLNYAP